MDQIVAMIVEKTGMSEDMARTAATVVLNFIKQRLPESVQPMLDQIISTGKAPESVGDVLGGALGGLFGGKD